MKRPSTFLIGFVSCLALALLPACKKSQPAAVPASPGDPTRFIPPSVTFVLKWDVGQILALGSITEEEKKQSLQMLELQYPKAKQILDALQIDLFKDIQGAALGLVLNSQNPMESDGVLALKTSLALDKLASVLKEKAADTFAVASFDDQGLRGYTVQALTPPSEYKVFLTSQSGMLLASGTVAMLKSAIEISQSGSGAFSSGKLSDSLGLVDRDAQFLLAFDGANLPRQANAQGPMASLQDIQMIAASLKVASAKYTLKANLRFSDPNNAQTLASMAQGFLGMMGSDPQTKEILQQITIKNDKNDIKIEAFVTEKQVKDFQAKRQQQAKGAQQPLL